MRELEPLDLVKVVSSLPDDVRELLQDSRARIYLCGGFIRDTINGDPPKDLDVFGPEPMEVKAAGAFLGASRGDVKDTLHAVTVGPGPKGSLPVQFIWTWPVPDPQTAILRMDFTMCQAVIWWQPAVGWMSLCVDQFYEDIKAKRLRYTWPDKEGTAGRSMIRALNFVKRGWHFPTDEVSALMAHTAQEVMDPDAPVLAPVERIALRGRFSRNVSGIYFRRSA